MKLINLCLVLTISAIAGCKGQLAEVKLSLAADGSGSCDVAAIRDVQFVADQPASSDGILRNATELRSVDLQFRQTKATFASIDDFAIGDITFKREQQDGRHVLTVKIPASGEARWFGSFGVSERSLEVWDRIQDESRKDAESRRKAAPPGNGFEFVPPRPPNVRFEINFPGRVEGQDFESVPLGLTTKVAFDSGERQASLSIPLRELHAGKMKEIVWKIRYAVE